MEKTIGTYEDLQNDQIIYFVYSSEGRHRIIRYKVGDVTTSVVLEWDGFGWAEDTLITGVGMVGDILIWCEGLDREIRSLNITKKAEYDAVKATAPNFLNLIKQPPLLPLSASRAVSAKTGPNLILDHSFVFSYRYVYADGEISVLAPHSEPVYLPYNGEGGDNLKEIQVTQTGTSLAVPPLVNKIEFLAKRDEETVWYSIKSVEVTADKPFVHDYAFRFDNSSLGNAIAEDDALRLYDAIWPAKTLTVARNRVFYANFAEGYDGMGDAEMLITLATAATSAGQRIFKSNNSDRFGVVYYDTQGRNMGVISKPEWQANTIPSVQKTTGTNFTEAQIALTLSPPAWAKYWRLVKSRNPIYDFFIQGYGFVVAKQIVEPDDTTQTALFVHRIDTKAGPEREEAVILEMFIDISSLLERNIGYVYETGDRLNVYYGQLQDDFERYLSDVKIIEQQGSLLKIGLTPELMPRDPFLVSSGYNSDKGIRFEIFRQNSSSTETVFFETSHGGEITADLTIDLTIKGDAWLIPNTKKNPDKYLSYETANSNGSVSYNGEDAVFFPWMEAMSPWDRYYSKWSKDLGRISTVLPDNLRKRIYKSTSERFSNKFISGSQVNGLSSFEGLNEKDLPMENGPIQGLRLASNAQAEGTVLLAIMQNETESQYLGEAQWRDTQGRTTSAISDSVIGSTNTLRGGHGTINPESIAYHDGRVYFWDATKGEVVRYSADGLTPLARLTKMGAFFREVSRKQLALDNQVRVQGGYDAEMDEYLLTFQEIRFGSTVLFAGFTVAYSEKVKGFVRYSFQPEFFCKSNTRLLSFLNGQLYLHGGNSLANNFYGEQYTSQIRFLSNQQKDQPKVWQAVSVEGEELWVPTEISNDKGQLTRMKPEWFENLEGVHYGAIRRDLNSKGFDNPVRALNNGDELRSQFLEVLIETDSTNEARLDAMNVHYIASSGHSTIQ